MSSDIPIAVVGVGARACDTWLPLLQRVPGYRVVGLYDIRRERSEQARTLIDHEVVVWDSYERVLEAPEVAAVALTVRSPDQGALAVAALRAGKHVHAEVPAAHSIEDCWQLVEAVRDSGRVYALAEQTRYWGFIHEWTQLRAAGRLGMPLLADGQYFHYLPDNKFANPDTGELVPLAQRTPQSVPTWSHLMPPLHYLPHQLSPLLKVLDDRVVEVTGMATPVPSLAHPEIEQSDIQTALMRTSRGTILRVTTGFASPHPEGDWHWYQVVGTQGTVEWRRSRSDDPKAWFADSADHDLTPADWSFSRPDAPPEAAGSGHGDADFYVHANFRDAVLGRATPEVGVIDAVNTAAPAILAAQSIAEGGRPIAVPDFTAPRLSGPGARS